MAFTPITGQPVQYSTEDNEIASGYYLKFYDVATLNGYSVAVDSTGTPTLAKVKLNAAGYPISNPLDNDTVFIPHVDQSYRIILYKTEADADADNTTNADFNVDNIQQDISPSADAKDIALRNTDVETQDDYDRSPLFIDGDGFTAGAGPHVITVPAATPSWVPSNADTRFYRVDSSGIITDLTPTSKDATTFTLTETLLSTDTIFIGDDNFRNQMDGDPLDIRTRLSVISTAESDAKYLLESNNLSDLDSISTARTTLDVYSESEVDAIANAVLRSRASIFSGSAASVDIQVQPDGFYLVTTATSRSALIYKGSDSINTVFLEQIASGSFLDTTKINLSVLNVLTCTENSANLGAGTTSVSAINITKVERLES